MLEWNQNPSENAAVVGFKTIAASAPLDESTEGNKL